MINKNNYKNTKIILYIVILCLLIFVITLFNKNNMYVNNNGYINKKDNYNIDLVPSGNKIIETFNNNNNAQINNIPTKYKAKYIVNGDPETELAFLNLDTDDQKRLCSNKIGAIGGYRNKTTGATFRFQKIDPSSNNELYFLLASVDDGRVIMVDINDNLKLTHKSSTNSKQHFIRKQIDNELNTYYFIPVDDNNKTQPRALQYEFNHLTLRLINNDNKPYEGQKFEFILDNETINKTGLSYNIGIGHLDKDDIIENFTNNKPFELKLKVNVNQKITDLDAFNNLINNSTHNEVNNLTNKKNMDVRTLLNDYLQINNTNNTNINNNLPNLNNTLQDKLITSFKECPTIDRSKYITKRQLSRCYGCNPDSSLE